MRLFDSHCHLQDSRITDLEAALQRASERGVEHIVCSSVNEHDWDQVTAIARKFPGVIPSYCIHPMYSDDRSPDWLDKLEQILIENPMACIGETGLDRWEKTQDDQDQLSIFIDQLMLAKKLNRPKLVLYPD